MIQVINRALDIIEYIASDNTKPKLLNEIANKLDIKASTCANIIKTLVQRDYLQKANQQKGYELGNQIKNLIEKNEYRKKLIEASDNELQLLTDTLNENSLIAVMNGENRLIINKKTSKQIIQAQTPDEKNAYDSSSGRLMIALYSDTAIQKHIDKYGLPTTKFWPGISTYSQLIKEITKIRENGYVLIEDSIHVIGFAAPIKYKNKTIASLSIYMPAFRYSNKIRENFINIGLATAEKISNNLNS